MPIARSAGYRLIFGSLLLSASIQAQTPTTTSLVSLPPAGEGSLVPITANVSPSGSTGRVTFYDGATILGMAPLSSGTATFNTTLLPPGQRTLHARYDGDT